MYFLWQTRRKLCKCKHLLECAETISNKLYITVVSKSADLLGLEAKITGENHQVILFAANEEEQFVWKELLFAIDVIISSQRSSGNF